MLLICVALTLAACAGRRPPAAPPPRPDPTAPARAAFGDALEAYQGQPLAAMQATFGAPSETRAMADGGTVSIWDRLGETTDKDGQTVKLDCRITVIADAKAVVTAVFGGGSTLFCAREFPPVQGPNLPVPVPAAGALSAAP